MNEYNDKGERHGYWEYYSPTGQLYFKGNYKDDIWDGYCEVYYETNGNICYKGNFIKDEPKGYMEWFTYKGELESKFFYL